MIYCLYDELFFVNLNYELAKNKNNKKDKIPKIDMYVKKITHRPKCTRTYIHIHNSFLFFFICIYEYYDHVYLIFKSLFTCSKRRGQNTL